MFMRNGFHLSGNASAVIADLIRFNKIAIQKYKFQTVSGQGSHWLIEMLLWSGTTADIYLDGNHVANICSGSYRRSMQQTQR